MSRLLDDVVGELSRLPGVGRRTALRLAMHMLRMEVQDVELMAGGDLPFPRESTTVRIATTFQTETFVTFAADETRDRTIVCVVEQVKDVISIENTRQYRGLYHVLGGIISPMQGIGPSDLKIDLLLDNIAQGGIKEVILALSTSVEGETTSFYLSRRLSECTGIRLTSIARGIGFGDELDYADELTIAHALHNRRPLE